MYIYFHIYNVCICLSCCMSSFSFDLLSYRVIGFMVGTWRVRLGSVGENEVWRLSVCLRVFRVSGRAKQDELKCRRPCSGAALSGSHTPPILPLSQWVSKQTNHLIGLFFKYTKIKSSSRYSPLPCSERLAATVQKLQGDKNSI